MSGIEVPELFATPPLSTPWVPLWPLQPSAAGEVAFGSFATTINVPTSGVTPIVSAGSVQCDGTPLIIEFFSPIALAAANGTITAQLYVDGVAAGIMGQVNAGAATDVHSMLCRVRYVPTPGAHTIEIRATASTGVGQYIAGAGYTPGHIRITRDVPSALPLVNPTYGTSFPATPADGMEHILVDSVTNPNYQWRFRYNAGSASPYKWEYVGGAAVISEVTAGENTGSAAYVGGGTPGPSFTLPRAGDYEIGVGFAGQSSVAGQVGYMSYDIGATGAADADAAQIYGIGGGNPGGSFYRARKKTGLAAGAVLLAKYRSTNSTFYFSNRYLRVVPVRVS